MPELLLYLDQNDLSGIAKRKPGFRELEPVLRAAVAARAVAVPESMAHTEESAPRPDLGLLELVRELSGGRRLDESRGLREREIEARLAATIAREHPERRARASDVVDLRMLTVVLPRCRFVTCDAFMADVVRRLRLDLRYECELFTGRRADVARLRERLEALLRPA